jgi:hypothetical protein
MATVELAVLCIAPIWVVLLIAAATRRKPEPPPRNR